MILAKGGRHCWVALGVGWLAACATANSPEKKDLPEDSGNPGSEGSDGSSSGTDGASEPECVTDLDFWSAQAGPLLLGECGECHTAAGIASATRMQLDGGVSPETYGLLGEIVAADPAFLDLLREKPTGQISHAGGKRFGLLDPEYPVLHELIARLAEPGHCEMPGEAPITCGEGVLRPGSAPLRRLNQHQVANVISAVFGLEIPDGLFPAATRSGDYRTFATANTVTDAGVESIQLMAEYVAAEVDFAPHLDCGDTERVCAERAAQQFGESLYRRPLSEDEAAGLMRFFEAGLPPAEALGMVVEVLLQSPQFLYMDIGVDSTDPGSGRAEDGAVRRLDDFALASRLSFFLTDGPPDAALLAAAADGSLRTRAGVADQARRLIESPAVVPVVGRFHQDWLHLYRMDAVSREMEGMPTWNDSLRLDLLSEVDLFVGEVVWFGDARFESLMFSNLGWVSPNTAPLYGLDPGAGWQRVAFDPEQRPGILSRAAFLTTHAHTDSSAPILRGAWILEAMLCEELAPPPGVNAELPREGEGIVTIRDKLEAHRSDPTCAGCHDSIDPAGLAFENYGVFGEWRDEWTGGIPVDASGSLDDPPGDFANAAELLGLLASSERVKACYARRWFEYGVGRAAEPEDACTLEILANRFEASDGDIRGLLLDLTLTDAFRMRATEEAP